MSLGIKKKREMDDSILPSKFKKTYHSKANTIGPNASREIKLSVGTSKTAPMLESWAKLIL